MSSFFPNSGFLLSGTNLTEASHILWGPTRINSDRLIFEGTTGVKGIVPASAASQDKIFIITNDGEAKEILGTQPTIALASGDAIKVGDLENAKLYYNKAVEKYYAATVANGRLSELND